MRFWTREVGGWILVLLGLWVFYAGYRKMTEEPGHFLLEAGPVFFAGFIIFRGGIHLLKVAVAAQVCLEGAPATPAANLVIPSRGERPVRARRPGLPSRLP